ncbi:MAG: type II toxin-antitoxin system prevent-host-death family antitoxin [Candidatus Aureabacteria bacterium]|nr:type II toxin-antitoxin system prevent-host-death family antitoxin [Candidatus Auribacterota bacterium]
MAISDFKARALYVLGQVAATGESVIVTKRGKPLAEVAPIAAEEAAAGKLSDALVFEKDIVSPLGEDLWAVCR